MKTERKGSWKNTTEKITSACVILNGIFVVYDIPTAVSFRPILQYRVECEIGVTARSRAHWQMPSILFSFFDRGAKAFSLYRSSPLRPPPHDLPLSVVLRFVYGLLSLMPPSHPDPVKDSRTREPPEIMRKCRKPPAPGSPFNPAKPTVNFWLRHELSHVFVPSILITPMEAEFGRNHEEPFSTPSSRIPPLSAPSWKPLYRNMNREYRSRFPIEFNSTDVFQRQTRSGCVL